MELDLNQLRELSTTATQAAAKAAEYIQSRFDEEYEKKAKTGGDSLASQVVTEVDFKAQEIILRHLASTFKQYDLGLLTEELIDDQTRLTKDYFWCIDPLDGTLPFTERRTGYAVSISLISNSGNPMIGVVNIPDKQEEYSAIKGEGIYLDNNAVESKEDHNTLHVYMDSSFLEENYQEFVRRKLSDYGKEKGRKTVFHFDFGGVRNAISVMTSGYGCYFKFPRVRKGCGSIWDYAATRLFFEEQGLSVSNALGKTLYLNSAESTFMNEQGIVYASDKELSSFILELEQEWRTR